MIKMDRQKYEEAHNYDLGDLWEIFRNLPLNSTVLDVGCGTGRVLDFINKTFPTPSLILDGVEKNMLLTTPERIDYFWSKGIGYFPGNFDTSERNPYDYLLFVNSLHQMPNPEKTLLKASQMATKGIIIETVDTSNIHRSTISKLYPALRELHFPIKSVITDSLNSKGFPLVYEKSVEYRLLINTNAYIQLLKDRFISSLHNLSEEMIMEGSKVLPQPEFFRVEVMKYLVYERK